MILENEELSTNSVDLEYLASLSLYTVRVSIFCPGDCIVADMKVLLKEHLDLIVMESVDCRGAEQGEAMSCSSSMGMGEVGKFSIGIGDGDRSSMGMGEVGKVPGYLPLLQ